MSRQDQKKINFKEDFKMSFASKFNKDVRKFTLDTEGFEYYNLSDLYENNGADEVYPLFGFYINKKGNYGDAPVAYTDEYFVNLPQHMLEVVKNIMTDEEGVQDINEGKVGFKIYEYMDEKHNKKCYSIRFEDIEVEPKKGKK
jgi:hypothetical protein